MADATDKLLKCLADTVVLLRLNNQSCWADWFEEVHNWIGGGDHHAVEQLGKAFGGMGSFNDLVLQSRTPRHEYPYVVCWSENDIKANERLAALRTRMFELLIEIRRERR